MAPDCDGSIRQPLPKSQTCPCQKCKRREQELANMPGNKQGKCDGTTTYHRQSNGNGEGFSNRNNAQRSSGAAATAAAMESSDENDYFCYITAFISAVVVIVVCTSLFWIIVSYYVMVLAVKIYNSDARTQKIALSLIALLVLGLFLTVISNKIQGRGRDSKKASKSKAPPKKAKPPPPPPPPCKAKAEPKAKPKPAPPPKSKKGSCATPPPPPKEPTVRHRFTITIVDEEYGRQLYKGSKSLDVPCGVLGHMRKFKAFLKNRVIQN